MTTSLDMTPWPGKPMNAMLKDFIQSQFRTKVPHYPPAGVDLAGQVAIVTGSNLGLGFEAAKQLAALGLSRLIMAVRTPSKGEAAAEKIRAASPACQVDVWPLDMSSYASVQAFAQRCATELPRLDMAVLNAGGLNLAFSTSADSGHETTVQVNYLSTVLLATLLLPTLRDRSGPGTPGRLSVVSSGTAMAAPLKNRAARPLLPSFDVEETYAADVRYWDSKLLGHLWMAKLAAGNYVSPDDVVVSLVDPGLNKGTGLGRDVKGIQAVVFGAFVNLLGRKPQDGANTYVDAVVVKGKESHGCYLANWRVAA